MTISLPDVITIELPQTIIIPQPYVYLIAWWIGVVFFSFFLKVARKMPNMREGIITALSILIMYVAVVLIDKYNPIGLKDYTAPLPFLVDGADNLVLRVYSFNENGKVRVLDLASQVGSLFVLSFLVNQIYEHKPGNLKTPGWLVYRFFSTMFCIGVHYCFYRVLQKALSMVPADSLLEDIVPHLPIALLGGLLALFVLGAVRKFMGKFFKEVNFAFQGLNGFFFSSKFGVIVTRAICTTAVLTIFAYGLQRICESYFLVPTVALATLDLGGYVTLIGLFVLWVFVGFLM